MGSAGGVGQRISATLSRARARWPRLDRAVRTHQHYSAVGGNIQAGGVTYFAFLSFFPILAVAFSAVGYVAGVWPDAEDALVSGLQQVLPGLVGDGPDDLSIDTIKANAGTAGVVGLAGVLYAGLGWLSALRGALQEVFQRAEDTRPNFLVGKLRDLATLSVIGTVLLVGVAVSGVVSGYSAQALDWLGLDTGSTWALWALSLAFGLATSTVMFFAMFTLLARPRLPRRTLWGGALLGAVGYELLKLASTNVLNAVRDQPSAAVFGFALVLVVWMYYFSRVILYAAAWAQSAASTAAPAEPEMPVDHGPASVPEPPNSRIKAFLGGAGLGAVAALVLRRRLRDR